MPLTCNDNTHTSIAQIRVRTWRGVAFIVAALLQVSPTVAGDTSRRQLAQAETQPQDVESNKKSIKTMDGQEIDIDEARKSFEEHQKKLKATRKEQQNLEAETKRLDAEQTSLQSALLQAAKKGQDVEARLVNIETSLEKLTARELQVRKALNENRAAIAQMLGIMQRMGREPPPILITERNDALRMVRSAMLLSSFLPGFKERADKLSAQVADLDDIIVKSHLERKRLADAKTQALTARTEIETLLTKKREKMQKNWARLEDVKVAAAQHSNAVTNLGGLLQRLDTDAAKLPGMAEYEKELRERDPSYVLKPEAKQSAFVQPGRIAPAMPFDKTKGMLPLPAQGKRLVSFGGHDEAGVKIEGLRIETRPEAQVIAPADGWVIYAGQFRSYGQLLIINAGGGYHILLAGVDQIYTTVGQFVVAGEPIGVMNKAEPSPNSTEIHKPVLYIEFRKDAHPIDPDPWWSESVKEG